MRVRTIPFAAEQVCHAGLMDTPVEPPVASESDVPQRWLRVCFDSFSTGVGGHIDAGDMTTAMLADLAADGVVEAEHELARRANHPD